MAILINLGQRGFVLREGYLNPKQTITVDQETAEKLSRAYPNELKIVVQDTPKVAVVEPVKVAKPEPKVEAVSVAEPVAEQEQPKKAKRTSKRKAK